MKTKQKGTVSKKKIEYCEGCGCTPCDCDWGTMELRENHTNHVSKKADKDKPS